MDRFNFCLNKLFLVNAVVCIHHRRPCPPSPAMASVQDTREAVGRISTRLSDREDRHAENERILKTKMTKLVCAWLVWLPAIVAILCQLLISSWQHPIYRNPAFAGGDLYDHRAVNVRVQPDLWQRNRFGRKCFSKDETDKCSVSWGTIFFLKGTNLTKSENFTAAEVFDLKNVAFSYGQWTPLRLSSGRYEEEGFDLVPPISYLLLFTSIVSLIGSCTIIGTFFYYSKLKKKFSLRLVFYMAFADLGFSIKFLMSSGMILSQDLRVINNGIYGKAETIEPACIASGLMGQFFGLSTICWNFSIALNLLFSMLYPRKYDNSRKQQFHIFAHSFSWGFPLLTCLVAYFMNNVVMTYDGTCWMYGNWVFMFYAPLFIFIIINVYAVKVALVKISPGMFTRNSVTGSFVISAKQEAKNVETWMKIFNYCLAFISTWIWGMVLRLGTSFQSWNDLGVFGSFNTMTDYATASPPPWLVFASAFFLGAGGAINASIWLEPLTRQGRRLVRQKLRRASLSMGFQTARTRFSKQFTANSATVMQSKKTLNPMNTQ